MSPAVKLLRLILAELESKAAEEEFPEILRIRDVGVLANKEKETTIGGWLRDEGSNRQFCTLISLLSYLPATKIEEIFSKVLPPTPLSIKKCLEDHERSQNQ